MPLISVVIPAYNSARTIAETVSSVLTQTHTELQVIVVDDGSRDETVSIVREISDSRVETFTVPNGGPAASRNRGFARCQGEYVSFLDSDDLWTSEKLAGQLLALESRPAAGLAYSWTDYIDEHGNPLYPGLHETEEGWVYRSMLTHDFLENGSNALLRRELAEDLRGFDETVARGSEDWEYFIRAARQTEFVCVQKPQVLYRVTSTSLSSSVEAQLRGLLQMIAKAYEQAGPEFQSLRAQSEAHIHMYLAQKALDSASKSRSLLSFQLLGKALWLQPDLITQPRPIAIALTKAMVAGVFPPEFAERLFKVARQRT